MMRRRIGITGQHGFVGSYLYNTIELLKDEFELVEFERDWFGSSEKLDGFVNSCDAIVHLAAVNRHEDPMVIYETNVGLVMSLLASFERTGARPHVLISSSTQEERDNLYGKSKKEGRELLTDWSKRCGATYTGMIIPNVFGPFGQPYYNSVVATFCHQISRDESPNLEVDGQLKLIYVGELVNEILRIISAKTCDPAYNVNHTAEFKVSDILALLNNFRSEYQENGNIPSLQNPFELNLFNTYRCYIELESYFPRVFKKNVDSRGTFVEVIRLGMGGQVSFSTTVPGITRGNHFHTRKIERFAVIKGSARIQMRRIGTPKVLDFILDGDDPGYVDMPIWYTHNIKNIGEDELLTVFWINEHFNPSDPDTYFINVED